MNNEPKKGRGGARANSGAKASGIKTVTVRIDERLLNVVTRIKNEFKDDNLNIDDLFAKPAPQNDDAKLLKKIAKLEREKKEMRDGFFKLLESRHQSHDDEISELNAKHAKEVESLNLEIIKAMIGMGQTVNRGIDEKLRKRLIQFCHPDKHQDERTKEIANGLIQDINGLKC